MCAYKVTDPRRLASALTTMPAILSAYKRYIQKEKDANGEAMDPVLNKPIELTAVLLSPTRTQVHSEIQRSH